MTSMGVRSPQSDFGDCIAVCAPTSGEGGHHLVTADLMGAEGTNPDGNVRKDFGETSGAAAIVSGVAALVLAACPEAYRRGGARHHPKNVALGRQSNRPAT